MSERICTFCRGETTSGCEYCNPVQSGSSTINLYDQNSKSYWASEAGRLTAENVVLRQRNEELKAEIERLKDALDDSLGEA
jgi:hypothetical protein